MLRRFVILGNKLFQVFVQYFWRGSRSQVIFDEIDASFKYLFYGNCFEIKGAELQSTFRQACYVKTTCTVCLQLYINAHFESCFTPRYVLHYSSVCLSCLFSNLGLDLECQVQRLGLVSVFHSFSNFLKIWLNK